MSYKIEYILLTLLACVLCLTSCSSDPEPQAPNLVELKFDLQNISRASITNNDNFKLQSFRVFGDMKPVGSTSSSSIVVFNGDEVKYNSSANSWEYSNTQYWFPKHEYSFVAVHPATVLSEAAAPQYSGSRLSFTYTLPSDNKNATDILIATHRRECGDYKKGTTEPVRFKFSHILSLLNIAAALDDSAMGEDEFLQFSKLELTGLNNKATLNVASAPLQTNGQTDDSVVEVTNQGEESNLTIAFSPSVKVTNHGEAVSFFNDDDALIMLPQTFAADSNAQLILTYTVNGTPAERQVTVPLKNIKWESGKSYAYKIKLTIDKLELKVETTITDWEVVQSPEDIDAH